MTSTTFEANLSDHHKLATTTLRKTIVTTILGKTISEGNSRKKILQRLQEI